MFLDTSALVAILTEEPEAALFVHKIERTKRCYVSAIVLFESATAVARIEARAPTAAQEAVCAFFKTIQAQTIAIDARVGASAFEAFTTYGMGNHPAALTMGDCFTYACAKVYRLPVLFKGDGFQQTDLTNALDV